jgi:hypothetical protein
MPLNLSYVTNYAIKELRSNGDGNKSPLFPRKRFLFTGNSVITYVIDGTFYGHKIAVVLLGVNFIAMALQHKQK